MSSDPILQAILARFPGAQIIPPDWKPSGAVVGSWHQINAPTFDVLAPAVVRSGWSCFPQTRDDRRGPGIVDGRALAWGDYQKRLPTAAELSWWSSFCPSHNVAGILGDASGGTFAIDVDVDRQDLSLEVVRLADRILGPSPFRRVGRAPRIVLLYRQGLTIEVRAEDRISSRQLRFAARHGEESPGAVEILAHGKPVTFFGLHHKTGKYFIWLDKAPHHHGPELAPLVTRAQIDEFLDACNDLRPFARQAVRETVDAAWTYDEAAGLHRPTVVAGSEWTVEEGKITDGRSAFLFALVKAAVAANEGAARDEINGHRRLCALVETEFRARADLGGRWTPAHVKNEIASAVARSTAWHVEHDRFARVRPGAPIAVDGEGEVERAPLRTDDVASVEPAELKHLRYGLFRDGFLQRGTTLKRKGYTVRAAADPVREAQRALIEDEALRIQAAQAATRQIRTHQDRWIDGLYERAAERRSQELRKSKEPLDAGAVSILRGDAGVGKTSTFWRAMARAVESRGRLGYPVGFAMPSHANIEDSIEGAKAANLAWELSAAEAVQAGEQAGLKVVIFRGRLRTNCGFKPQIRALNAASVQAERLCKSRVNRNEGTPGIKPEWEEVRCPMFEACEYQNTLAEVADADVVLFASAYLSVKAPAALTKALVGLVVDERPYSSLLSNNAKAPMPIGVLALPRQAPRLLQEELAPLLRLASPKEAINDRKEAYLLERSDAVDLVMPHLRKGDAGGAVLALHNHRRGNERTGLALARSAYAVCSRTNDLAKDVKPGMTEEAAMALASAPRGEGLWDERRFWSLVIERLEALAHDEENPGSPRKARGESDARLQVVVDGEAGPCVRMSWRGTPGFPGIPLLMLDASAAPQIVQKIWADREVEVLDVQAPCHMRTVVVIGSSFSDQSMIPRRSRKTKDIVAAAKRVQLHREVVTRLSGVHGAGKLLVGGNLPVMRVLREGWTKPVNVDFVHNGAMRGLDQFKHHSAAILFGRLELPLRAVDAFVAALTYDDETPEEPVDRFGNGRDGLGDDAKPLRPTIGEKRLAMRDGSTVAIDDSTYEGDWAKIIQRQFREEEVKQFAARLRPVHRLGVPPVVYLACSAIPEGTIVDAVIKVQDLIASKRLPTTRAWELARETDGVVDPRFWAGREDLYGRDGHGAVAAVEALRAGVPGEPETQGLSRIRWRLPGGEWSVSSVLTGLANPAAALARTIAAEQSLTPEEVEAGLEWEVLWKGQPRAASGTKAIDKIDRAILGLADDAVLSEEELRAAYRDREAMDRAAMMRRTRLELSGLPEGASEAAIDAALIRRRITEIDWDRVLPHRGADRKIDGVPLAVRVLAALHGIDEAEDLEEAWDD